jgi:ribonuclease HIII
MPDRKAVNIKSFNIDKDKMDLLKEKLESKGFLFSESQSNKFLQWRARKDGICIDTYNTGRVVFQGREANSFLADTNFWSDVKIFEEEGEDLIGVDESGKGDYFGPLVIGAVLVRAKQWKDLAMTGIMDSKSLTDPRISHLSSHIKKTCPHSLVVISPERYNQLYNKIRNLNRLLAWGHARALENILNHWEAHRALSDQFGDKSFLQSALLKKGKKIELEQRPKAEKNLAVAAASIIARNEFLKRLKALGDTYKMVFPKGAGPQILQVGRDFIQRNGFQALSQVAKLHFKTTKEITT